MKKSLIALAVLATSGAAMAQSSVTLFGIVDANVGYVNKGNAAGNSVYGLGHSGNATSRLGFRGVEDLGGGLKAGFWLEGAILNDNGGGYDFKRESTVRLSGGFGEVRLGRELTPTYRKVSSYDVFGQVGMGQFKGWSDWAGTSTADANAIRQSNMVSYYTPNMSGFTAGVGYGFDENASGAGKEGRYAGAFAAYDNGPLSVALSFERRNVAWNALSATGHKDNLTVGASYDLGAVKLNALLQQAKFKVDGVSGTDKYNSYALGLTAPVGAGQVRAQYVMYDQKAIDAKAHQLALGYVHNLSKRTAVYGTLAFMKNKDGSNLALGGAGLSYGGPGAGKSQTGVQMGLRHAF